MDVQTNTASGVQSAAVRLWMKRILIAIIAIIIATVAAQWIKSWGGGSQSATEWVTVAEVTCSPTWNNDRGWCTVVAEADKGTYRVIPRYKSWQLWQNDGTFISVPPYGLDLYAHWKEHKETIDEFHKMAHKKGSNNVGALVVRVGNMEVIEALNTSRSPREFEITEDGTEIAVTVNLTPLANFYKHNQGTIPVEVQRQD